MPSSKAFIKTFYKILTPPSAPDMNDQVIREGFRQSPEVAPTHLVLLAEAIPLWLPVIDGWGAERLFMHCEREELWYRYNLHVETPLTAFPTGKYSGYWDAFINIGIGGGQI